ncbi:MAG: 50S ribosomal protein L23 [Bacteroidia bacterium]|nr:50S ribosomal protein L23 [Bacteroidia bacterium]MCX7764858.1 50S ribosomal protein L23 [Bacteroidia bacterium]MDW8057175.1 50S ribosomal protein L23 [Bacteroidia bacterium]
MKMRSDEVLIKPLFTEKAIALSKKKNAQGAYTYVFKVAREATKPLIAAAIEEKYGVKVDEVRTAILPARIRYRYTRKGIQESRLPSYKKAYVRLKPGYELNLYENL